jgi:DNA repair exonuclease SbcCD nuclease subunit
MTNLGKVTQYTPKQVATDLMETIKNIENAISSSEKAIKEVEGRGFLKNIFSSSSSDLVTISKSQNDIDSLMLSLIQEIITLNVMSYSYLAAVLAEFHKNIKDGWIDSEGRFQELSENGEVFANTASNIFEKIIEGSRSTQEKIEFNSERIENFQQSLEKKDALDEQQSQDIANLKSALRDKSSLVEEQSLKIRNLSDSLSLKKNLIDEQSKQMEKFQRLLEQQKLVDEQLNQRLAGLIEDLQYKEAQGVSRDNAIVVINDVIDGLRFRYRILSVASGVIGLGMVLLVTALWHHYLK